MATAVPAGSPLDGGVAHVPLPCQNVPTAAPVPLFRLATAKLPVTPVDSGKLVASVKSKAGVAFVPPNDTETPP